MSEKNLLFFYYNFDSTTLFSFGGETIMDYYFLLMARNNLNLDLNVNKRFREFGMERFVGAVMWIMQEVFGLERELLLCEPDEK